VFTPNPAPASPGNVPLDSEHQFPIMVSPDEIFANWHGVMDNDFYKTLGQTFDVPENDPYVYRAESFTMTLSQIREQPELKYKYQAHGQAIEVRPSLTAILTNQGSIRRRNSIYIYLLVNHRHRESHQILCLKREESLPTRNRGQLPSIIADMSFQGSEVEIACQSLPRSLGAFMSAHIVPWSPPRPLICPPRQRKENPSNTSRLLPPFWVRSTNLRISLHHRAAGQRCY
jgi:hypothetical protein